MLIHNALITGSLLVNGTGYNTGSFSGSFIGEIEGVSATASYVEYNNIANKPALVSGSAQIAEFGYATTGSNQFNGNQAITGSLTTTGQIIAQTLNVQQVTSSIVYSSGSNIFGNDVSNTQQFTGSLQVSGSLHYLLGNVGVGTATPNALLDVNDLRINGGANPSITDGGNLRKTLQWDGANNTFGVFNSNNAGVNFQPNLFINAAGNVGIGTTSPRSTADVNGILTVGDANPPGIHLYRNVLLGNNASFGSINFGARYDGSNYGRGASISTNSVGVWSSTNYGGNLIFSTTPQNSTTLTERMRITSSGLVGIGTASPGQLLTLGGTVSPQLSIVSSTTTGSSEIYFGDSAAVYRGAIIYDHTSDYLTLHAGAGERMRILSNGDVRINHTIDFSATFSIKKVTGRNIANFSNQTDADLTFTTSEPGATPFARITPSVNGQPIQLGVNNNNVLIGTTSNIASSRLRVNGNIQIDGFQKMYTYYIIVQPNTTGTITISSPTGSNIQGSMQVMAGGYGNGITGNITGLWMVGGLLFFNNASTSTITQIVNSVTDFGSMSFQRSGDQYTVSLTNTASSPSSTKTFYVSVIINGD